MPPVGFLPRAVLFDLPHFSVRQILSCHFLWRIRWLLSGDQRCTAQSTGNSDGLSQFRNCYCVLHKVLNSYQFLGFLRLPDFALLTGLEDA